MARLDNLGTAKGVAQLGATIGRQFSYDLLQAVSPLGEASLQSELEQLIDAELIYQRGVTPNPIYIFKHALVQDTAYETLLRSTRQGYHRRIAEVLEERFPETVATQPELLAHHSTEAGFNQEAVAYWKQAGERAIQRSANIEAIAHLTQGLEVRKTLPDTPESRAQELALHLALGSAFLAAKGYAAPEVEQVYIRAWELCQHVQDSPQLFSVLVGLRLFYSNRGALKKAQEVGDQLLTLAARLDEPALLLEAHYAQGVNVFRLGDLVRAREHLEHATALYVLQAHNALPPRAGHDHEVGYFTFASRVLLFLGYPEQAYEQSAAALRRAHELSQPLSMAFASMFAIRLHIFRHEIEAAHAQIERMLHLATTYGFGSQMPHATFFSGWLLTVRGQPEQGIARMHNGLDDLRATGVALDLSYVLALIAECQGARRRQLGAAPAPGVR